MWRYDRRELKLIQGMERSEGMMISDRRGGIEDCRQERSKHESTSDDRVPGISSISKQTCTRMDTSTVQRSGRFMCCFKPRYQVICSQVTRYRYVFTSNTYAGAGVISNMHMCMYIRFSTFRCQVTYTAVRCTLITHTD